jgi:plastocyanin
MRQFTRSATLVGLLALTVVPPAGRAAAAGSSIAGTVKATGLASNADAVIFIEDAQGGKPSAPATMDQRKMQFIPHVLPVAVGTTVKFLNSDPTPHNVFTPDYEKYNLGTWPQGQSKEYVFSKCAKFPCAYTQLCRVHPEMEGFVVVVPNTYFAVSDREGHYEIPNVSPGKYTVVVWHPRLKGKPQPVTVEAGKSATLDFVLSK